jgi:hypothetical protein
VPETHHDDTVSCTKGSSFHLRNYIHTHGV